MRLSSKVRSLCNYICRDTGYVSYRAEMWKRLALTGQPQVFTDYAEYQTLVDNLIATGAIKDPTTSVQKILKYGNGAQRQLEIYQKNQNFQDVANYIVAQTKVMIC